MHAALVTAGGSSSDTAALYAVQGMTEDQYAREPAEGRKGRTVPAPAEIMQVCFSVTPKNGTRTPCLRDRMACPSLHTHSPHLHSLSRSRFSPRTLAWTPACACAFLGLICASSHSDVPQLHCMTHKIGGQGLGWVERARLHKKNWVERPDSKLSSAGGRSERRFEELQNNLIRIVQSLRPP